MNSTKQNREREEVQLQRQGISHTLRGHMANGDYIIITFYHGSDNPYYFLEIEHTNKKGITTGRHVELKNATTVEEAISIAALELNCQFNPEIEAYCYSDKISLRTWPYIANDVYITCATYETITDTIRHEPSNICLINFSDNDKMTGKQYKHDPANRKYTEQIKRALEPFNSNVAAHGIGTERKEWLAWLVSQYIRDIAGERPIRTKSISKTQRFQRHLYKDERRNS